MTDTTNILTLPPVENLKEILEGMNFPASVTKGTYSRLEFRFKDNSVQLMLNGIDIKDYSLVWLSSFWHTRDLAFAAHLYLDHHDTPHTFAEQSTSKITDQVQFTFEGIHTPNTFYIDRHNITRYVETIEDICGYPLIIKDTVGSRGKYSAYVENRKELIERMTHLPNHTIKYMFQEYIQNDYDWGILVSNGVVVSAEKSYHADCEFRNNACKGATEVFVDIQSVPEDVLTIALNASRRLGLTWSRSDIVVNKKTGLPYLLEVNRSPGITSGTSEVLGARDYLLSIRPSATKHTELEDILMAHAIAHVASFPSQEGSIYGKEILQPDEIEVP
jgi:hypothetical protein